MGHSGFAATIGWEAGGRVNVGPTVVPPKGLTSNSVSVQDAIQRRFKRVLARFTILSILLQLEAVLGVGLLGVRQPGLN